MKRNSFSFLYVSVLFLTIFSNSLCTNIDRMIDIKRAMTQSRDLNIRYVDFIFLDIEANLKKVTYPISRVEGILQKGFFFDGSSVSVYTTINDSDLLAIADLESTFLSPWRGENWQMAYVMCDVYKSYNEPYQHCPRFILKNAIKQAADAGFTCKFGLELEFYLMKKNASGLPEQTDRDVYCDAETDIEITTFK